MAEPSRPKGLPASAVWDPEEKAFLVCGLVNGKPEGEGRLFRPDGTLACVTPYVNGVAHGPYTRYHPNGKVSQTGTTKAGTLHGLLTWFRIDGPTPEATLPTACPPSVREMRAMMVDGVAAQVKFYDARGRPVLPLTGEPLPPRPKGVDEDAWFSPDEGRWFMGLGSQAVKDRHGVWRWWDEEGHLVQEHRYERGKLLENRTFRPGGMLSALTTASRDGEVERRAHFDAQGRECLADGSPLPQRPAGVSPTAVFDEGDYFSWWVEGPTGEAGRERTGTWRWWSPEGELKKEETYEAGRVVMRREHSRHHVEETRFTKGKPVLKVRSDLEGQVELKEVWHRASGRVILHELSEEGQLVAQGVGGPGGLRYEFFDDGAVVVEGVVAGEKATGRWVLREPSGVLEVDLTDEAPEVTVDEEFDAERFVGDALLEAQEALADDGQGLVRTVLPGVDAVAWGELGSAYGEDNERFPFLLRALSCPSPTLARCALLAIGSETLHQGTIYEVTAAAVPFVVESLGKGVRTVSLLNWLWAAGKSAQGFRQEALGWDEGPDRRAVLGVYDALGAAWPTLERLAADPDPRVRSRVISLAAFAGASAAKGIKAALKDPDTEVVASALMAYVGLPSSTPEETGPLLRAPKPVLRAVTAFALARRFGPKAPAGTVAALVAALQADPETREAFSELHFTDGSLVTYASAGLSFVGGDEARAQVVAMAKAVSQVSLFDVPPLVEAVFTLCFGDGTPPFAPKVIEALAELGKCKTLTNFANYSQLADEWCMPETAEGLAEFAAELARAEDPTAVLVEHFADDDDEEDDDGEDYDGEDDDAADDDEDGDEDEEEDDEA